MIKSDDTIFILDLIYKKTIWSLIYLYAQFYM